jgi:dihydroxyacetone kinase
MVGTMGVALSVCALPGQVTSDRLGPEKMELGLGVVCCFSSYFLL